MSDVSSFSRAELEAALLEKDGQEWREIIEWDWAQINNGETLHAVKALDCNLAEAARNWCAEGTAECGRRGWLSIPGMGSRMSAKRCERCCAATGMPQGTQSPKNVDECRPIAEARVAELRATIEGRKT